MGTVKVQAVAPSVTPAGANERDKYMKSVNSKEGLEALREAWKKGRHQAQGRGEHMRGLRLQIQFVGDGRKHHDRDKRIPSLSRKAGISGAA